MERERLQVWFESPEALRSEFEKNIANGGIFVATDEAFEVRQLVTVDIELTYAQGAGAALELEAEVVHLIPVELAGSGAVPGIALQFEAPTSKLLEEFEVLLGQVSPEDLNKDLEGDGRRSARRGSVRVPVRVMPAMSPPFEATSRDLSASGILISMREDMLPVGEVVRICLWHPSGDPSVELDAKVVRQVNDKKGRIAAIAVAFDRHQAAEPRVGEVIEALSQAGHRNRLGGISGSLVDLGLANMIQMFGASAPQGTIVVEHHGEEGWIAFAEGDLVGVELGALTGHEALVEMLDWGDGQFVFEASVTPKVLENAERRPLAGALLEAVCTLDERDNESAGASLLPDSTFDVDQEQVDLARNDLGKIEDAVLELARSGLDVAKLCAIIPEPSERVQEALESLVELGVLVPR